MADVPVLPVKPDSGPPAKSFKIREPSRSDITQLRYHNARRRPRKPRGKYGFLKALDGISERYPGFPQTARVVNKAEVPTIVFCSSRREA